jgi:ATP-binding cassette subfamily C protein CydD
LGPAFLKDEHSGELSSTLTEGIEALDGYFRDFLPSVIQALVIPLSILLLVIPIDALTSVVMVITAPLIPLFMALIGIAAGALARDQYTEMQRLSAHFIDVLQGLTTLKLFNRSRFQITTIGMITEQFRQATMRVLRVAFLSAFMLEMLATLSVAIVAVEVGLRLLNGGIDFQPALFLLVVAPEFYIPLRTLGARFHNSTAGSAAAGRIYQILATPPAVSTGARVLPLPVSVAPEVIRFSDVTVHYPMSSVPALQNITLTIRRGEHLAVIGTSGSGKSTLLNLLLQFIQPNSGQVSIDGTDLSTLDSTHWREKIAWVSQKPFLLNATIADNIRMGKPTATSAEIQRAAEQSLAHQFIVQMAAGYNTPCGENGVRLSGGQAQRIALARAFLKDAPILLLDEMTSHLDSQTERLLLDSIRQFDSDRIIVFATHRLIAAQAADRIVLMQDGHIAGRGTPGDLLATDPIYQRMIQEVAYDD